MGFTLFRVREFLAGHAMFWITRFGLLELKAALSSSR